MTKRNKALLLTNWNKKVSESKNKINKILKSLINYKIYSINMIQKCFKM